MSDPAHQATDAIIAKIEKDITKEYKKAHKEVTQKLDDYLARFATKDKKWQEWVANGTKTAQEYKDWKMGQILVGQRWADLKDSLAKDYGNAAKISQSIANGYRPEVYALNHNYSTFEIEKKSKLNTSYTLYSRESVERMYRENPRLYHKPGQTISQQIKEGKLARWDKRRIQSVLMQGILQGESIPNLTQRLEKVTGGDHKAAIRNIRTMMTGVQNAGRVDAQERAKSMGIPVKKQWLATLDSRTRHWHRELDGEVAETDEPFENEIGKIMFPGDPDADPANIYNCRCTLLSVIEGHELDINDDRVSYADEYADMDYDEWKEAKKSYSNPIDLPEKKAAAFKQSYINEYAGGHGGQHAHTAAEGQRIVDQYNQDQSAAQAAPAHVIAEGKDITDTWQRRPEKYDFAIDDVLSAQGFDGVPRVVSAKEFDDAVKKSNFVAQRIYSAPDAQTISEYQKQLYGGKWYVDCSVGGAHQGQGMYCVSVNGKEITKGMTVELSNYEAVGASNGNKKFAVETFTISPDAKAIEYDELKKIKTKAATPKIYDRNDAVDDLLSGKQNDEKLLLKRLGGFDLSDEDKKIARKLERKLDDESLVKLEDRAYELRSKAEKVADVKTKESVQTAQKISEMDDGVFAASKGFDIIHVSPEQTKDNIGCDYSVILNRTKVIFKEGAESFDYMYPIDFVKKFGGV